VRTSDALSAVAREAYERTMRNMYAHQLERTHLLCLLRRGLRTAGRLLRRRTCVFFFSDDQISICRTSNVLVMRRLQTKFLLRLLRHLFTSLDRGREPPADRLVDL
jgi:hypothetical protein